MYKDYYNIIIIYRYPTAYLIELKLLSQYYVSFHTCIHPRIRTVRYSAKANGINPLATVSNVGDTLIPAAHVLPAIMYEDSEVPVACIRGRDRARPIPAHRGRLGAYALCRRRPARSLYGPHRFK